MRFTNKFFILLFGHFLMRSINAVPVSVINNDPSNGLEEEQDDDTVLDEDDNTTHGLGRLSSAATCLVAGVEYTHGQQIYRKDACEFCLCLDGEMFCWWQDCPPAVEGPCKDRGPFSPCMNVPSVPSLTQSLPTSSSTSDSRNTTPFSQKQTTIQQQNLMSSTTTLENANNSTDDFSIENSTVDDGSDIVYSSEIPASSTEEAQRCIVMGREYKIGDKLPHDTGNCIECICGQGAKLSCSPHQCAPVGDDINDYRPPGPRQPVPDVF